MIEYKIKPISINEKSNEIYKDNKVIKVRYSLELLMNKNPKKSINVIMMNPSKADCNQSDATVNKVIDDILKFDKSYNQIYILNVLPVYESKSSEVNNYINDNFSVLEKDLDCNIAFIKEIIKNNNSDILLATGSPANKGNSSINYMKNYMNQVYDIVYNASNQKLIYGMNKNNYTKHPSRHSCKIRKEDT